MIGFLVQLALRSLGVGWSHTIHKPGCLWRIKRPGKELFTKAKRKKHYQPFKLANWYRSSTYNIGGKMKTIPIFRAFILCLVVLALMPIASSSAAPATSNLAPNPSFERGKRQLVNGWTPQVTSSTFTWNKGTAYDGRRSICIGDVGNYSSAAWFSSEWIPVSQGADYVFSAYAKGDFDGIAYIGFLAKDASGTITDQNLATMSFDNVTWTFTQTRYRPAISTVAIRLELAVQDMNAATSTPSICFDYVSLIAFPYAMP
jgi:hypothetical protein